VKLAEKCHANKRFSRGVVVAVIKERVFLRELRTVYLMNRQRLRTVAHNKGRQLEQLLHGTQPRALALVLA